MLTDPQTIVVAGVTKSLPKTSSKDQSSTYNTADLAYTLKYFSQRFWSEDPVG